MAQPFVAEYDGVQKIYRQGKRAVALLYPQDTVVRYLQFPKLSGKALSSAIYNEYKSYAVMNQTEPVINWRVVKETDANTYVLAIGVRKDLLNELFAWTKRELSATLKAAVAVVGVAAELVHGEGLKDFGVAVIDREQTDLLFYKDENPVFGRNISIGHADLLKGTTLASRDIMDLANYIDEAIVKNFSQPVPVFIVALGANDREIIDQLRKISHLEFRSFEEVFGVSQDEVRGYLLEGAWTLSDDKNSLFVFIPELYKKELAYQRKLFYITLLVILSLASGGALTYLQYLNYQSYLSQLSALKKQEKILKDQLVSLKQVEDEYNKLKKTESEVSNLSFVSRNPVRWYSRYLEIIKLAQSTQASIEYIKPSPVGVDLSLTFPSEGKSQEFISAVKSLSITSRVVIYSTAKIPRKDKPAMVKLNMGVAFK